MKYNKTILLISFIKLNVYSQDSINNLQGEFNDELSGEIIFLDMSGSR
jgi:hypothetical protein